MGDDAPGDERWAEVLDRVPGLGGRQRRVTELPGGLTNVNLRVTTAEVDVVVRIAQPGTDLLAIDRQAEHHNSVAAAEAGVAPEVVAHVPAADGRPPLLVVRYVDGRTWTADDLHDEASLVRAAQACRRLHAGPRFLGTFDMVAVQARYRAIVEERGFRLPEGYDDLAPAAARVAAALAVDPPPLAPCHNDLLAANFVDDGERLWLIDYEYSASADPSFELGNAAAESRLPVEALEHLVAAYRGRSDPVWTARAQLWGLLAHHGWTLWAAIQDAVSSIDHDFWEWGMEKYELAVAGLRDPGLDRLLETVTRG